MFDCHIHTDFSTDSKMSITEAIKRARETDLGIIVTEHMDLLYPDETKYYFDVKDYMREFSRYRDDKVLLGMEMGMRLDCVLENKYFNDNFNFDYIVGSVHVVNGIDIYEAVYYDNRDKRSAYEEYFKYILDSIKLHDFVDSLGHIDYIARYARAFDKEVYYEDYRYYFDDIFKTVISNGQVLEINTRRFSDKSTVQNLIKIYKRYNELGGKYVVLGSDSHYSDNIGKYFDDAERVAEICGLNLVHFKERQMILSK